FSFNVVGTILFEILIFFFSSRRRHTRSLRDWSSDVCSSDLHDVAQAGRSPDAVDLGRGSLDQVRLAPEDQALERALAPDAERKAHLVDRRGVTEAERSRLEGQGATRA